MKTGQVNLRLEADLIAALERAAEEEALDRGTMLRKLLLEALERRRLEVTLAKYQRGETTLGRASEETGLTQWDLIELLRSRRIPYSLSPEDAEARLGRWLGGNPRVAESPRSGASGAAYSAAATLPDHPPRRDGVLLVGINPAPTSLRAGHYYQGRLGKRLWRRLARLGLLEGATPGREDEAFTAAGHGLTDVVGRATSSARELDPDELKRGASELRARIRLWSPRLVLFVFQEAAKAALGRSAVSAGACGELEGVPAFLLSGPYASRAETERNDTLLLEVLKRGAAPSEPVVHTQRITPPDIAGGRIRLRNEALRFFPADRTEMEVILRGERLRARYDPREGAGGRSAVLSVGKSALTRLVRPNESLRIRAGEDGLVRLG